MNYAPTEGEALSVVHFITYWRKYLHGKPFTVVTDHSALVQLLGTLAKAKDLDGRLARWQLKLQRYQFTTVYREGRLHSNVDALTRQYPEADELPSPPPIHHINMLSLTCPNFLPLQEAVKLEEAEDAFVERRLRQEGTTLELLRRETGKPSPYHLLPLHMRSTLEAMSHRLTLDSAAPPSVLTGERNPH
jgi:hypothetical protein